MTTHSETTATEGDDPASPDPSEPPEPADGESASPRDDVAGETSIDVMADPTAGPLGFEVPWLALRVRAALGEIERAFARVSVRLVGDARMTDLHRRHLGLDSTTDVLTFGHDDADEVDIAVCVDEARRQASGRGHALGQEVLLYAVHGLLHCSGFDDRTAADAAAMHAEEDRILGAIGVGAVYRTDAAPDPEGIE